MRVRGFAAAGILVVLCALAPTLARQQAPPQFKTSTDLVVLDVSVLDKNRRPVSGLTAGDFVVSEDGVPQPIAAFKAIEVPGADLHLPKWMGRASSDVQSNKTPDGRVILIYLDERTLSTDPFFNQTTKNVAHAFVDQLAPNDIAAVAFVLDHRGTQEFTTDRGRLHAAIDSFAPSPPADGVSVVGTLRDLAVHLGTIPDRRKVIVYVGSGEPFDVEVLTAINKTTLQSAAKGSTDQLAATGSGSAQFDRIQQQILFDKMLELFRVAQQANVSIYTIDPIGLTAQNTNHPGDSAAGAPDAPAKEFLRIVAANTGGRAIVNDNGAVSEVPSVLRENSAYYLIGIRPGDLKADGRFRRLQVKVNRPNVEVHARRGFVDPKSPGSTRADGTPDSERAILPASEISLDVCAIPIGPATSGLNSVALSVRVGLPSIDSAGPDALRLSYSVLDMGGKERGAGRREFSVPSRGSSEPRVVNVQALEHLPSGRYDIRVSATSVEGAKRGEIIADVQVPDFGKDPLSGSGLIIEETPPPRALPLDALSEVLKGIPTTSRSFASDGAVTATLRLSEGKTATPVPVTVNATITDAHDRVVFKNSERLGSDQFVPGYAEYKLNLPLAQLEAGLYLLQIEATRPSAPNLRRQAPFEVKPKVSRLPQLLD